MNFTTPIKGLLDLIYPVMCPGCDRYNKPPENLFCVYCEYKAPYSRTIENPSDNELTQKFSEMFQLVNGIALFTMDVESEIEQLIRQIKYHGRQAIGVESGQVLGKWIKKHDLFTDIDLLLPVPLHKKKYRKRTFNQSERICEGMADILDISIDTTSIVRSKHTRSQTSMSMGQRRENMGDAFTLNDSTQLVGKHICVVDDVVTTGSTVAGCLEQIVHVEGVRLSVACLGLPIDY